MMRVVWFSLGFMCMALGVVGAFLPLLPTVPLLLLAAFFFSKSSKRAHKWLMDNPRLGPPITDWNNNGVIQRGAKIIAGISIVGVFTLTVVLKFHIYIIIIQGVTLLLVSMFIFTRPEK